MSPDEFRAARRRLGLSQRQLAQVLGVSKTHVRRLEADPEIGRAREIQDHHRRLIEAYLSGYRPPDWPL